MEIDIPDTVTFITAVPVTDYYTLRQRRQRLCFRRAVKAAMSDVVVELELESGGASCDVCMAEVPRG